MGTELFWTALALSDEVLFASVKDWASHEGILLSPEGAAATAGYDHLIANGFLKPSDKVVLFNTGSGNKYTDVLAEAFGLLKPASAAVAEDLAVR
jgi:threonine synthase